MLLKLIFYFVSDISSVINIKELTKSDVNRMNKETEEKLQNNEINDQDRYILNHQLETLKEISI